MNPIVLHNPASKAFELFLDNKKIGKLEYAFDKPGVVELYHTVSE
jgi:hypothetical protein